MRKGGSVKYTHSVEEVLQEMENSGRFEHLSDLPSLLSQEKIGEYYVDSFYEEYFETEFGLEAINRWRAVFSPICYDKPRILYYRCEELIRHIAKVCGVNCFRCKKIFTAVYDDKNCRYDWDYCMSGNYSGWRPYVKGEWDKFAIPPYCPECAKYIFNGLIIILDYFTDTQLLKLGADETLNLIKQYKDIQSLSDVIINLKKEITNKKKTNRSSK